jgi:hypothetical protein
MAGECAATVETLILIRTHPLDAARAPVSVAAAR